MVAVRFEHMYDLGNLIAKKAREACSRPSSNCSISSRVMAAKNVTQSRISGDLMSCSYVTDHIQAALILKSGTGMMVGCGSDSLLMQRSLCYASNVASVRDDLDRRLEYGSFCVLSGNPESLVVVVVLQRYCSPVASTTCTTPERNKGRRGCRMIICNCLDLWNLLHFVCFVCRSDFTSRVEFVESPPRGDGL